MNLSRTVKNLLLGAFISVAFVCASLPASAYGPIGHRVIGAIAERHLTPEAKAAIAAILTDESLAEISTWPDEMRSSPEEFWQKSGPYHYVNIPDGVSYEESVKNPAGDAMTALEKFSKALVDPASSPEDKRLALAFVVHIIGDLHQPLHAGRPSDRGGNSVKVLWFDQITNLHTVWDELIINHMQLSYSELTDFLDRKITPDELVLWQNTKPIDWLHELVAMRDGVYASAAGGLLSWDYVYTYTPVVKDELSKGGIRLAGYLNTLFAEEN